MNPAQPEHRQDPRDADVAALARRLVVVVVPRQREELLRALAELLVAVWLRGQGARVEPR